MKYFFTAVAWLLLLAACAGGWTEEDKENYIKRCHSTAGGMFASTEQTDKYCRCNLDSVMKYYPTIPEVTINKDSAAVRRALEDCSVQARR